MKLTFTLTFFFALYFLEAQIPLIKQWDYRFGGTYAEEIKCLLQTNDGGYILGGWSVSDSSGDKSQANFGPSSTSDYWVVKIDSLGNKQWDKVFGGTESDDLFAIQQTTDGGYILGGTSGSGIGGNKTQANWGLKDYWIIKIDSLGIKQWDKDFGGIGNDYFASLQQTTDGGYVLAGYSTSGISGDKSQPLWGTYNASDFWILKIDSLGSKLWDRSLGGLDSEFLNSVEQTLDGGYILGGSSYSGIGGDKTQANWGPSNTTDYWIVKTDSLGLKIWDKDFGGTFPDYFQSLQQTSDGGYIIGGTSFSGISGNKTQNVWGSSDYWIIKTDSNGIILWDKDFGGSSEEEFFTILQTTDGGYLLSGDSYSPMSGNKTENNLNTEQTWVLKLDSLCNILWDKTLHTITVNYSHDETGLAIQANTGCYVMVNSSSGGIGGDKTQPNWDTVSFYPTPDYWLIKFCESPVNGLNQTPNNSSQLTAYPNPVHSILYMNPNPDTEVIITNLLGEIVLQFRLGEIGEMDVSILSPGIYFLRTDNEVLKILKE